MDDCLPGTAKERLVTLKGRNGQVFGPLRKDSSHVSWLPRLNNSYELPERETHTKRQHSCQLGRMQGTFSLRSMADRQNTEGKL